MKLLTLNTHSLVEDLYEEKLNEFVDTIFHAKPDILALQEVNQTCTEEVISKSDLTGFFPCEDNTIIRRDNHVYNAVKKLQKKGLHYYWTWIGMKLGYDKYDEGIALMSLSPIISTDVALISKINDYHNWKTRKIIGICTEKYPAEWFYSVHLGWWNDEDEPFKGQWERTDSHMKKHETVWLMGDFNSPAEITNEGYDMIAAANWYDSYLYAKEKDNGITVDKVIDGWKERPTCKDGMRIDLIWCNKQPDVNSSNVIFNGINRKVVSDHYGVMVDFAPIK